MDIPDLIDEYNRTKRQKGEPVMTQRRLAMLAGVSETLVSLQAAGYRNITEAQERAYLRILRVEAAA
jgi:hypothetical protein